MVNSKLNLLELLSQIPDPEIPVINIVELGIVRGAEMTSENEVEGEEDLVKLDLIPSSKELHQEWKAQVEKDFTSFGIAIPTSEFMQKGSRKGIHTEYFGFILCELQYMQRAYPDCTW